MEFKELASNTLEKIRSVTDNILDKIPEEKRRLVFSLAGGVIFFGIILVFAALVSSEKKAEPEFIAVSRLIPADELFYPAEPDFVPALLLEREPRQQWTAEDLLPFWQDPKQGHEDEWRREVRIIIDKLMEGVP